jgi:hypothetical protein
MTKRSNATSIGDERIEYMKKDHIISEHILKETRQNKEQIIQNYWAMLLKVRSQLLQVHYENVHAINETYLLNYMIKYTNTMIYLNTRMDIPYKSSMMSTMFYRIENISDLHVNYHRYIINIVKSHIMADEYMHQDYLDISYKQLLIEWRSHQFDQLFQAHYTYFADYKRTFMRCEKSLQNLTQYYEIPIWAMYKYCVLTSESFLEAFYMQYLKHVYTMGPIRTVLENE